MILIRFAIFSIVLSSQIRAAELAELLRMHQEDTSKVSSGRMSFKIHEFNQVPSEVPDALTLELTEKELSVFEKSFVVRQLNSNVTCQGTLTFDLRVGAWKYSVKDTRDLKSIAQNNALSEGQAMSLSRERTIVIGQSVEHFIMYHPGDGKGVLTIMKVPNDIRKTLPFDFGRIPDSLVLSGSLVLSDVSCHEDLSCTLLHAEGPAGSTYIQADVEKRYRYRRIEKRAANGTIQAEWIASDYRLVSGYWIPFRREDRYWSEGKLDSTKLVELESIELNCSIPESELSIEAGTDAHVSNWISKKPRGFRVRSPITVTLDTAPDLNR